MFNVYSHYKFLHLFITLNTKGCRQTKYVRCRGSERDQLRLGKMTKILQRLTGRYSLITWDKSLFPNISIYKGWYDLYKMTSDEDDIKSLKYITDRILVTILFHSSIDVMTLNTLGNFIGNPEEILSATMIVFQPCLKAN